MRGKQSLMMGVDTSTVSQGRKQIKVIGIPERKIKKDKNLSEIIEKTATILMCTL